MRYIYLKKGSPPIDRFPGLHIQHPDSFWVLWIGIDMLVIPRTRSQIAILAEPLPVLTAIVGSENRSILCINDGPDAILFSGRNSKTDLTQHALRETRFARNLAPGIAAISRFEDAAVFPPADKR